MVASSCAVLLLLARAGALHPLGWPTCLPQSPPRVVAGCTSLAAAQRSRSLSCAALDQHTRRPGVASRAPAPRLCAGSPGRPVGGVVPSWRRWLAAVAKTVKICLITVVLLAAWPFRRLPLRRGRFAAREPEEQREVNPGEQPGVQPEVLPSASGAADATDLAQQVALSTKIASEVREPSTAAASPSTDAASSSGGAAPSTGWGDALFDFGNRIGRGDDAATPTVLLDEICLVPGAPVVRVEVAPGNA